MASRFEHLLSTGERPVATLGEKLRLAEQMRADGIALYRRSLRREHPDLGEEEREKLLADWLHEARPLAWPLRRKTFEEYFRR